MKTRIVHIIIFSLMLSYGFSQQEQMYTQFMFNKQLLNPAYTANDGVVEFSFLMREQWISFPGAPSTQILSFASPFGSGRAGFGMNIQRQSIGITDRYTLDVMYAYRFELGEGTLSAGIQASGRNYTWDFTDERLSSQFPVDFDPSIDANRISKQVFNAGFGLYYNTKRYYLGFAIPRLIPADLEIGSGIIASQEYRHFYFMGGASFGINPDWDIIPQLLVKQVYLAPLDLDISVMTQYQKRISMGLNYRLGGDAASLGESIDLLVAAQLNPSLLIGISYDISLSKIKDFHDGSLELALSYRLAGKKPDEVFINPRYF